ncbi:MAG: hypothetical protein ABFS56_34760 [Pseudomonadota bacterium]
MDVLTLNAISCRDITGKIMYQELFKAFENVNNLGGKAWEHAVALDLLNSSNIQDCSIHCFHYQQMFECFFKYILETKSQFGAYSKSHKLNKLLEEVIGATTFKTNKSKYRSDLIVITVCAEEYRYNFDIDCQGYLDSVTICDELIKELIEF